MVEKPEPALSRHALRRLVSATLRTASDLDAFCLDFFPEIQQRFDSGMDRVSKLNLLLALSEGVALLGRLREAHPQEMVQHEALLQPTVSISQLRQRELTLEEQFTALLQKREVLREFDADTTRADAAISDAQRRLRRGPSLNCGEVLAERYQLVKVLGDGTFADVWEAQNLQPNEEVPETVAVKVLHGNQSRDPSRRQRFITGVRQLRRLSHPYIVRVFSEDMEFEGFHYFLMEYLAGGDLYKAVLRDHRRERRERWLQGVLQIGEALTTAHDRGLIHRDVKPQNILFDEQWTARLVDFDLVLGDERHRLTRTKMGLGTLPYAAPEQLRDAAHVDARADVYGLGRTALFVLYGQELPDASLENREDFLSALPVGPLVRGVLQRATAWDPESRYTSAAEFCAEFKAALEANEDVPILLAPTSTATSIFAGNNTNKPVESKPTTERPMLLASPSGLIPIIAPWTQSNWFRGGLALGACLLVLIALLRFRPNTTTNSAGSDLGILPAGELTMQQMTQALAVAMCRPQVRQLIDDVSQVCSSVDVCIDSKISTLVGDVDPTHTGRFISLMDQQPHVAVYFSVRDDLIGGSDGVYAMRLKRLVFPQPPWLPTTRFLVVSNVRVPDGEGPFNDAEIKRSESRGQQVIDRILDYRFPPTSGSRLVRSQILHWVYAFTRKKSEALQTDDQPVPGTDLSQSVWVFRVDCVTTNNH